MEIEKYQLEIAQLRDKVAKTNIVETAVRSIDNYSVQTDNYGVAVDETLEAIEQRIINSVMARNRGNISLTAQQLGITRQTLYNKLKKGNK